MSVGIALGAESKIKKKTDRNVHRRSYLYSLSVNGAILGYDMTMEDEMTKEETYDTHVYVEGRDRPLPVGMYTDEHSEICSIRFSNSFTLNVVTPQDLLMLAQELETFAEWAYELHYGEEDRIFGQRSVGEVMAELQQKLESCGVVEPVDDAQINRTRARYLREEEDDTTAEETMMKGTVSGPVWKDPSDPVNW
jgi:hypothetical protein